MVLSGTANTEHMDVFHKKVVDKQPSIASIRPNWTITLNSSEKQFFSGKALKKRKWLPNFSRNDSFIAAGFSCGPLIKLENGTISGVEPEILNEACKGWPIKYVVVNEGKNLWTTALHRVKLGTSHIAMCTQRELSAFKEGVDMTFPYEASCMTFLVPKPTVLSKSTFVFQAFPMQIWIILIIANVTMAIVLYVIALNFRIGNRNHPYGSFTLSMNKLLW